MERIRAACAAVDNSGAEVLLAARAECYLAGHPDALAESIRRLEAYAQAGADVLCAPGPRSKEETGAMNLLMSAHTGLAVADVAELASAASAPVRLWPERPGRPSRRR